MTFLVPLALFLISLICLGSWIVTYKLSGKNPRYELFSIDFALGALLFSCVAAFILGNFSSDLPFGDRLLLASKTSQVLVFCGGLVFGLAQMLLLGAAALLGTVGAFPIGLGTYLIASTLMDFRSTQGILQVAGLIALFSALLLDFWACRLRDTTATSGKKSVLAAGRPGTRSIKGVILALIAGIAGTVAYSIAAGGLYGDMGVGPHAGLLFFCLGVVFSTLVFSVFSFNIALIGSRLNIKSYLSEPLRQRLLGVGGGFVWAIGVLTALLAEASGTTVLTSALPVLAVLLIMFWGLLVFKEFAATSSRTKLLLTGTAVLLLSGFWMVASGRAG